MKTKNHTYYLLFLLLVLGIKTNAQSKDSSLVLESKKNIVKYNITSFLAPLILGSGTTLSVGFERAIRNRIAYTLDIGYGFSNEKLFNTIRSMRVETEIKYYLKKHKIIDPTILLF